MASGDFKHKDISIQEIIRNSTKYFDSDFYLTTGKVSALSAFHSPLACSFSDDVSVPIICTLPKDCPNYSQIHALLSHMVDKPFSGSITKKESLNITKDDIRFPIKEFHSWYPFKNGDLAIAYGSITDQIIPSGSVVKILNLDSPSNHHDSTSTVVLYSFDTHSFDKIFSVYTETLEPLETSLKRTPENLLQVKYFLPESYLFGRLKRGVSKQDTGVFELSSIKFNNYVLSVERRTF